MRIVHLSAEYESIRKSRPVSVGGRYDYYGF